jgi:hypothetical protein
MKEHEMGRVCSTNGNMKNAIKSWSETLKGRDHFECNGRMDLREIG